VERAVNTWSLVARVFTCTNWSDVGERKAEINPADGRRWKHKLICYQSINKLHSLTFFKAGTNLREAQSLK
jgi:hypothetical protein